MEEEKLSVIYQSFDQKLEAFFEKSSTLLENFFDNLKNDLRNLLSPGRKKENKEPKQKQRKYWIIKKQQNSGPKSKIGGKKKKFGPKIRSGKKKQKSTMKTGANGENICKKIGFGFKGKKQCFQPKIGPDLPKVSLCGRNIKPVGMKWIPCNVVKLKENKYNLD